MSVIIEFVDEMCAEGFDVCGRMADGSSMKKAIEHFGERFFDGALWRVSVEKVGRLEEIGG